MKRILLSGLIMALLTLLGTAPASAQSHDVTSPDGSITVAVTLDRRYLVDVGLGAPKLRRPVPLDGEARADEAGVEWRVVESDRPDADYLTQFRYPSRNDDSDDRDDSGADGWRDRYLFTDVPRELSYFQATCDYLTSAPESLFTGDPFVIVGTDRGYTKLTPGTLLRVVDGEEREEPVDADEWHDVLAREFELRYPA